MHLDGPDRVGTRSGPFKSVILKAAMKRITSVSWTPEQLEILRKMQAKGLSAERAALALKRSKHSVRTKAIELGVPFPSTQDMRRKRLEQEANARAAIGLPPEA